MKARSLLLLVSFLVIGGIVSAFSHPTGAMASQVEPTSTPGAIPSQEITGAAESEAGESVATAVCCELEQAQEKIIQAQQNTVEHIFSLFQTGITLISIIVAVIAVIATASGVTLVRVSRTMNKVSVIQEKLPDIQNVYPFRG